jgi:hypothetical protein
MHQRCPRLALTRSIPAARTARRVSAPTPRRRVRSCAS